MYGIIVGSGRLGSSLASTFSEEGHDIVVIDKDSKAFSRLGSGFNGTTVTGTGIDEDVLRRAGIERADFLCAVTSSDTVNLMVAQMAKKVFGVKHVVARIFDPQREEIYRELGINAVCSTHAAAREIRDRLELGQAFKEMSFGSGQVDLVTLTAGSAVAGRQVHELCIERKISIVAIERAGVWAIACPGDSIRQGDRLAVLVRIDARETAMEMFGVGPLDSEVGGALAL